MQRQRNCDTNFEPAGGSRDDFHFVFGIELLQALADIRQTDAVAKIVLLLRKTGSGISHRQVESFVFAPAGNRDRPGCGQPGDAVANRILNQRLKEQRGDESGLCQWLNVPLYPQAIRETNLFDLGTPGGTLIPR